MLELYCINYSIHVTNFIHLVSQAQKIAEHRRKYERKREEKEIRERMERVKKAREEHERAQRVGASKPYSGIVESLDGKSRVVKQVHTLTHLLPRNLVIYTPTTCLPRDLSPDIFSLTLMYERAVLSSDN